MSGNDQGGGDRGSESDFSERLKRLQTQVAPKRVGGPASRSDPGGVSPLGQAMRVSSEFIGGVVVGGALGWAFDWFLGSKPWGLIAFLLLGMVTGIYNVMRSSGFLAPATGAGGRKNGAEGP